MKFKLGFCIKLTALTLGIALLMRIRGTFDKPRVTLLMGVWATILILRLLIDFLMYRSAHSEKNAAQTEIEQIRAEIEKRREHAENLGLLRLLELFDRHLVYAGEGGRGTLPNYVTKVKATDAGEYLESIQTREVFFGEKSYMFIFKPNKEVGYRYDNSRDSGRLLLMKDGEVLFDLECIEFDNEYESGWAPHRVEVFIEGPWVQEILAFMQDVFALEAERKRRWRADAQEKELQEARRRKKKFGLE
jgi:hypothetical protein